MSDDILVNEIVHCMEHKGITDFNIDHFVSMVQERLDAGTTNEVIRGFAENLGLKV